MSNDTTEFKKLDIDQKRTKVLNGEASIEEIKIYIGDIERMSRCWNVCKTCKYGNGCWNE